jgi:hypothetical protein
MSMVRTIEGRFRRALVPAVSGHCCKPLGQDFREEQDFDHYCRWTLRHPLTLRPARFDHALSELYEFRDTRHTGLLRLGTTKYRQ